MTLKECPRTAVLGAALIGIAACSGSDDPSSTDELASISIGLTDAPVDDVKEVNVQITAIWVKSADDDLPPFQLPLEGAPRTVDLLEHTDENAAILVDAASIEPGAYEWLAMDVNAVIDNVHDSYAVTHGDEWKELFVPSGRVRLVDGFEIEANSTVQLIFDWDLRKGLVYPPGLGGGYILKPAFRILEVNQVGVLYGSIPVDTVILAENDCNADTDAGDYDVGNVVYVFAGHGVTPDDIDEVEPEPVTTVDATLNDMSTHYDYRAVLPLDDYTVAFTCQGANDLADENDTGNDDPAADTVVFFTPALDRTIGADPENSDVEANF
jgi:hypothetical protein